MKRIRQILVLLVTTFLLAEVALRITLPAMGYKVGKLSPNWMPDLEVDSLEVWDQFYTDSLGIVRANAAYWEPLGMDINSLGFHGGEWKADSTKPTVLFIGDSFTWGTSAQPIDDRSFVGIIRERTGWNVFNAGIPGADPVQYARIAKEYVPRLRPDYVVVAVYLGNDIMSEDRIPVPGRPVYYQTNAGWLAAEHNGQFFQSATEAHQYYYNLYQPGTWFGKRCANTAVGTVIMGLPVWMKDKKQWQERKKSPVPNQYFHEIRKTAESFQTEVRFIVIPNAQADLKSTFYKNPKAFVLKEYPNLFTGLEEDVHVIPSEKADYYPMPNGHYNNQGHAEAVKAILEAVKINNKDD